jgi:hypothetical protein
LGATQPSTQRKLDFMCGESNSSKWSSGRCAVPGSLSLQ